MQPVTCSTCANRVMVKKFSLAHTSVQWTDSQMCVEFATGLEDRATTRGCTRMRESIERAVLAGEVEVIAGQL